MNYKLHEKLKVLDIVVEDTKLTFKLLDEQNEELFNVVWRLMDWDTKNNEWIESPIVEERVNNWSETYFGVPLDELKTWSGRDDLYMDMYEYPTFNSFWKSAVRFNKEMKGKSYDAYITSISEDDHRGITVKYLIDGDEYSSNYNYCEWDPKSNKGYYNKDKMRRAKERFRNTFGEDALEDLDRFKDQKIKVQVKAAGKDAVYGDILAIL